jgi:hypothetical protein
MLIYPFENTNVLAQMDTGVFPKAIPIRTHDIYQGYDIDNMTPAFWYLTDDRNNVLERIPPWSRIQGGLTYPSQYYYLVVDATGPYLQTGQVANSQYRFGYAFYESPFPSAITTLITIISNTINSSFTAITKPNPVSLQDASGTVTTANTFQQVLAASSTRQYLFIENVAGNASGDLLYVNFGNQPTSTTGSIVLGPGQAYEMSFSVSNQAVWVTSQTTGCPFTCKYA